MYSNMQEKQKVVINCRYLYFEGHTLKRWPFICTRNTKIPRLTPWSDGTLSLLLHTKIISDGEEEQERQTTYPSYKSNDKVPTQD